MRSAPRREHQTEATPTRTEEKALGIQTDWHLRRVAADISDPQELIARADTLSVELGTTISPGFDALVFKASRGIEDIYELTYIRKDGTASPRLSRSRRCATIRGTAGRHSPRHDDAPDGWAQTIAALRMQRETAATPVTFFTAKTIVAEIQGMKDLGAAGVLIKAFDPRKLAADVLALLR